MSDDATLAPRTPSTPMQRRLGFLAPWVRPLLWTNLVVEIGIVLTGGLVRLTGSGLGCPKWPECHDGSITPVVTPADGIHPYIEFGNRTLTGVVGIVALLTVLAVIGRGGRRQSRILPWAWIVLAGVVVQAVLGGITVLTSLHPVTVSAHLLVSMVLISAAAAALWFDRDDDEVTPEPLPRPVNVVAFLTAGLGFVVMLLGTFVTGSGPHSGDADEPARYGFDVKTMSWLHADSVMLFCGLLAAMLLALHLLPRVSQRTRRIWWALLGVTVLQGLIGYVQYALAVPATLVWLHMLGASLMAWILTWAVLSVRR